MRPRSDGIIADSMDDYLSQSKNKGEAFSENFFRFQLYNFDLLSLSEDKETDSYNDSLSSNKPYTIKLSSTVKKFLSAQHKHPLLPCRLRKVIKKKRGLITQIPQTITVS